MAGPPQRSGRRWHDVIEHYTPDGALGRGLFALLVGPTSVALGVLAFAVLFNQFGLPEVLFGLVGGTAGLVGVGLALVVLWPVYLSLIGNVASAESYGTASARDPAAFDVDTTDGDASPETILKRRYAAGELTREEFERRLDDVLDTRPERRRGVATDGERGSERGEVTDSGRHTDRERTRN